MSFGTADPELLRVHIASREFKAAQDFVTAACKHPETDIEHEALLLAAIVCYARPFSENERKAAAAAQSKLAINITAVLRSQEDLELHRRIITLRNKAVAHSESQHYPMSVVEPSLAEDGSLIGTAFVSRSWHPVNERFDLEAFARIATAMRMTCLNRLADFAHGRTLNAARKGQTMPDRSRGKGRQKR